MIEGQTDGLPIATSLNCPGVRGKMVVRHLDLTNQPMMLKAGTTIDTFTRVEEEQVEDLQLLTPCEVKDISTTRMTEVPDHLAKLYKTAMNGCEEPL